MNDSVTKIARKHAALQKFISRELIIEFCKVAREFPDILLLHSQFPSTTQSPLTAAEKLTSLDLPRVRKKSTCAEASTEVQPAPTERYIVAAMVGGGGWIKRE